MRLHSMPAQSIPAGGTYLPKCPLLDLRRHYASVSGDVAVRAWSTLLLAPFIGALGLLHGAQGGGTQWV